MATVEFRSRRHLLIGGGTLAIGALALAAPAVAKTAKTDVQYQLQPQGKNSCGGCTSFIPGEDASGPGTCKIVEGSIPRNGWCILFAAKR
jgi:hypothetical protein